MTHWVNGSATTAPRSRTPSSVATSARSAPEVAGTIRSTMVAGKVACARIQPGSAAAAACRAAYASA